MRSLFFVIFLLIQGVSVFAQDTTMTKIDIDEEEVITKIEYVNCAKIDSIVEMALSKKGCTYKYGSVGPNSFDCSGLMYYTFSQFGIRLLRSSKDQYTMGLPVKKEDIRRGDLVFFKRGKAVVGHVGMVFEVDTNGGYYFVHASTYNTGVRIDHSTREGYANTFVGARRLIDCDNFDLLLSSKNHHLSDNIGQPTQASSETTSTQSTTRQTKETKSNKTVTYKVKQGDTLYAIAKKYKVSVNDIKKWNKLKSDKLNIDQQLKIHR